MEKNKKMRLEAVKKTIAKKESEILGVKSVSGKVFLLNEEIAKYRLLSEKNYLFYG